MLFGAVVWSPLAPAFPVVVAHLFDQDFGASSAWGPVEVAHRRWLRWALDIHGTDMVSTAQLYVISDRVPLCLLVQKAVWRYVQGLDIPIG